VNGEPTAGLRPVEWAQRILGHDCVKSTYRWLRREGVTVKAGLILESAFYRVWVPDGQPFDAESAARRLMS